MSFANDIYNFGSLHFAALLAAIVFQFPSPLVTKKLSIILAFHIQHRLHDIQCILSPAELFPWTNVVGS
jgi:hypothetical protein